MRTEVSIEELLRWRLASAQAEAPPGPAAAELLASARPWWEIYPERFQQVLHSVMALETVVGASLAQAGGVRAFDPVPTVIVRGDERIQAYAGLQYFNVRDGRLHFRFFLDACANPVENSYEVTFVSSCSIKPLFFAEARRLAGTEYRLDAEVPSELMEPWGTVRITDPMPFRLILRPGPAAT